MLGWLRNLVRGQDQVEKRASASGFTAEIIAARESYISGRRGIAELTATAQSCTRMWANVLSIADVDGTDLLDRLPLAIARLRHALPAAAHFFIPRGLTPVSHWRPYPPHRSP